MVNLIIPVFHSKETLPDALNSLVAQTKHMFITTIVADGDGEDYSEIVNEYKRRGLQINYSSREKNEGPGQARQYAMDHDSMCDYFMFLDSDDMLMPRAIEALYSEAKRNNADVICSTEIAEQRNAPPMVMDVNTTPVTWLHGKIYRAEYLRKLNIRFLPEIDLNEDSYFNLVAVNSTENRLKINEITYLWRDYKGSLTRNVPHKDFFEKSWIQYVKSQVYGMRDIYANVGKIPETLAAATVINIYNHLNEAIFYNLDLNEAQKIVKQLSEVPTFIDIIQSADFWMYINFNLKASNSIEDALVFSSIRFPDWVNSIFDDSEGVKSL